MALAFRSGNFQIDGQTTTKDDGRYGGATFGFTTYSEDGSYERTYIEVGGRSDHLNRAVCQVLTNNQLPETLTPDNALEADQQILREKPEAKTTDAPAKLEAVA